MTRYLVCLILLSAVSATAQNPIPRQGNSCPTDTYRSGDYCKPTASSVETGKTVIAKSGD
jgi:hypothetical protein